MRDAFAPVLRQSLSDKLAQRIRAMIRKGDYQMGDRLPPIMEMARRFGVGHPTIREALKKLETMGIVEIRHGSGVYVSRSEEVLVLASPDYAGTLTKKLLVDLISARISLEVQSAVDAVRNATPEHLLEMRRLLSTAAQTFTDDDLQHTTNMGFHRQIAIASGNSVLAQLVDVLIDLFSAEQRVILGLLSREQDYKEHLSILEAIELRDEKLAAERMRAHLEGVRDAVERWDSDAHPVT
ncbi:MAG TPA: FadR/GntR family transcriptional regulator [Gemmatimonadaceae bacterium]|jgi:GntR family transcriptional regulator, transcriptional repressor for pyruvate dehydrogenase complex|nr:FadR/GntR family transcriptional regulator [Gemmatimonadaceae bacterium]